MPARIDPEHLVHTGLQHNGETALVEIQIAASPVWFPIIRSVIDQLARWAYLGLDAAADLRLAVDEACGVLIALAPNVRTLVCSSVLRPHGVDVEITADLPRGTGMGPTDTLAWRLLRGLTDTLAMRQLPMAGHKFRRVQIQLAKHGPGYGAVPTQRGSF